MSDFERIKAYLQAAAAGEGGAGESPSRAPRPFITISRQAGASGRSLADAVLAAMNEDGRPLFQGWHAYDDELCEAVAGDPELSVLAENLIDERFRSAWEDFLSHSVAGLSPQVAVFKKIFKVIRGLASGGKAIIVGRAGGCVTRSLEEGVHIRLVAPRSYRISKVMERYSLDARAAERHMETLDDSRRRLVKTYFSKDIDDPLLYHAVFNMGASPLDTVARLVVQMVADKTRKAVAAGAAA